MTIADDVRSELMKAGGAAVRFNTPMSGARADEIAHFVAEHATSVLDLGCGEGRLVLELASRPELARIVGVDIDEHAIQRARSRAIERAVADRVRFEVATVSEALMDASTEAMLSIGASHAFDGTEDMFTSLFESGIAAAVVGDGVWSMPPTSALLDDFGALPTPHELEAVAQATGWNIAAHSRSTLDEWDGFEHAWIEGVRLVGTPEAETFADQRLAEYQDYRGVLGFSWLFLTR